MPLGNIHIHGIISYHTMYLLSVKIDYTITEIKKKYNTGFLQVYKELMYCPTVLPFFLHFLINTEYLNISWSTTLKSTLMIPNNFMCVIG
jgi:hypothetical protein